MNSSSTQSAQEAAHKEAAQNGAAQKGAGPERSGQAQSGRSDSRRTSVVTALAALGIVYGDLGTSPLYTYQTIVGAVGGHPSAADALDLLSLVVWALIVTVSLKYCVFVMRADNHGEGGILALMSLVVTRPDPSGRRITALAAMGLFGAALIYGDGVITPAISVLSALEGTEVASNVFKPYILPGALVILLALFVAQSWGTARIGRVFGPIMLLWFLTIGALGLISAMHHPEVLAALNPEHAIGFLFHRGWQSFIVLGAVFLAITGGEALYADMGHFGRLPIRVAWYGLVLPALLLSYAGQTALLIANPGLNGNPFFKLAPDWVVVPLVILATLATIIASQAIITGAFSLTRQAMQLGWFPGLGIQQTSDEEYGQIYVPVVNWIMMVLTLVITYGFGSSDRLAGAYGTAVSTTMLLTTALLFNAMRDVWKWKVPIALGLSAVFLLIDLAFFGANALKIRDGGWVPLLLGVALYLMMTTWHYGLQAIRRKIGAEEQSPDRFLATLREGRVPRVPGTAVFLSRSGLAVSPLMVRHITQIKALQETAVTLNVHFEQVPRISPEDRAEVHQIADGLWHVGVRFGFVEMPRIPMALSAAREKGCPLDLNDAVYFAAHDEVSQSPTKPRMPAWRRLLFSFMYRNAVRAPDRFDLPSDTFLSIGRQIRL